MNHGDIFASWLFLGTTSYIKHMYISFLDRGQHGRGGTTYPIQKTPKCSEHVKELIKIDVQRLAYLQDCI